MRQLTLLDIQGRQTALALHHCSTIKELSKGGTAPKWESLCLHCLSLLQILSSGLQFQEFQEKACELAAVCGNLRLTSKAIFENIIIVIQIDLVPSRVDVYR